MKFSNDPFHDLLTIDQTIQQHLVKDTPLINFPTIPEFYAGKEIFITGGSGYMGKVLIEKLLRSCPCIKTIFILLRPKKGKSIEERLKSITDVPLFDLLRVQNPDFVSKLTPVDGEMTELGLGLSDQEISRLSNVSIIFHSAASVRFDDSLKYAVLLNTRGTREVMELATKLLSIKVVIHVSTTYSNVFTHTVEEKLYPPVADWQKTIEICEKMDENQLDLLTSHYTGFMPNTYVFSKNLAEQVTSSYKDRVPVIIYRPSVVVGALKEPLPGWVDNFNGPMGVLLASTLGISKTMYCDPKNNLDMIPVDVSAKGMIVAAWKHANESGKSFPIYNCASGRRSRITVEQMLDIGITAICEELAMEHMVWVASGGVTLNETVSKIRTFAYQIIPAILIDIVMQIKNMKPLVLKITRKIYEANKAASYFVTNSWDFKNDNFYNLCSFLRLEDSKAFDYRDDFNFDKVLFLRYLVLGYRRYLLLEKDETIPKCQEKYQQIKMVSTFLNLLPYFLGFFLLITKLDISLPF